jgi:hypothetical protein
MTQQIPTAQRALGMWHALFAQLANGQTLPVGPDRDIVTGQDAEDALLHAAIAIDEVLQDGGLSDHFAHRALHSMHMLMVAREYVQPLPSPLGSEETLRSDLKEGVAAIRSARL